MRKLFLLTLMITMLASISYVAYCNPIPVPTLILEGEDITIVVSDIENEKLMVQVHGVYPFKNVGYDNVTMYFPIPLEAVERSDINVMFNEEPIDWNVVGECEINGKRVKYETVEGTYPLLVWSLENVPEEFNITVTYSYVVSKSSDGLYHVLYAMATGRLIRSYSKICTANITIVFRGLNGSKALISFTPPPNIGLGSTTLTYNIEDDETIIRLSESSRVFHGLERDLRILVGGKALVTTIIIPEVIKTLSVTSTLTKTVTEVTTKTSTITWASTVTTPIQITQVQTVTVTSRYERVYHVAIALLAVCVLTLLLLRRVH